MHDALRSRAAAPGKRVRGRLPGRRARVRAATTAVVALIYGLMLYYAALPRERPPSDDVADSVSLDLFHGDAVARLPEPKAETAAEPTPVKPAAAPVEVAAAQDAPPTDTGETNAEDKVLQQVLAAISNEPVLEDPVDPSPPTEVAPASAAYQRAARGGQACEITERVQDRLQATPQVHEALARIPRGARSVANAVMIWDGDWIDLASATGEATLQPLQEAIVDEVRQASDKCRRQEVRGPRFLTLVDESGTAIVVLGTGVWRWEDLAPEPPKFWPSWLRLKKS